MPGFSQVTQVECEVELATDFEGRSSRDREELAHLRAAVPPEAFGDVGHDRNGGASDLVTKAKVTREIAGSRRAIDRASEFAGFLPHAEVLETRDFHANSPSVSCGGRTHNLHDGRVLRMLFRTQHLALSTL